MAGKERSKTFRIGHPQAIDMTLFLAGIAVSAFTVCKAGAKAGDILATGSDDPETARVMRLLAINKGIK